MSMKQKLLITLVLLVATPMLLSVVASTWFAQDIAGGLLVEQAREKLVSVRELKKAHVEDFYASIRRHISTYAENVSVKDAAIKMGEAFYRYENEIGSHDFSQEKSSLENYYTSQFGEKYQSLNQGTRFDTSNIISQFSTGKITLQAKFIAQNSHPLGSKHLLNNTDDDSTYSELHKTYHPQFRNVLEQFGYYDIFIAHPETGDIIYSVFKELDFATSLINGPYANTGIGKAYRAAAAATEPGFIYITDFAAYPPSYEDPAAFIATPLFDEVISGQSSKLIGVIIFQIPVETLNAIMTNNQDWERVGLGKSGETYLVGKDRIMRSSSRFLLETPEVYKGIMTSRGIAKETLDKIITKGTTVTLQPVETRGVEKAIGGETGFDIFPDYRGISVLSAYTGLDIPGLDWYILSEIDEAEAFAPATVLSKSLLVSSGGAAAVMLLLAALLGWRFANRLTTPISRLEMEIGEIEKDSDLTRRLNSASNDVTVGIVESLNNMFEKLHGIVDMVAKSSKAMESASGHVNQVSTSTSQSVQRQSTETDRMTQAMEEIASTVVDVASNAGDADSAAKEANAQAIQGNDVVVAASASINDLAHEIQHTSEVISRLAQDSENIGGVLDVIRSIAEQTNLLALNAAIEAARAGEHGRGFAVVADEVRTLASRTQESTEEIQSMIERLQTGTREAVTAMTKGQEQAEVSVSQAREASEALQKITCSIGEITRMNENIASASSRQQKVSGEVSDSIRNISEISTTTTEGALKTEQASSELNQLSIDLKSAVQRFKLN
ncbi:MAG: methyl-accepting chemotaxis protein [Gammaproteobacteria bacterium]|nr:methyl-accepting chemotaxis protein [Gammaproteobacteria bacterium]